MVLVLGVLACVVACGGDDAIPIDDIPQDTRLVDLSSAEFDGVCHWAAGIARQKVPEGTNCRGIPIGYSGCMQVPADCRATVGQWRVCVPALLDRFAEDPCAVLDLAFSPADLSGFVEDTPGCTTLGPCATAMNMR
jgi:hypothetical protein